MARFPAGMIRCESGIFQGGVPPDWQAQLTTRFKRAIADGDLPAHSDADTLAHYAQTVNFGLTVQASTGATRKELLRIVEFALKSWPT